VGGSQMKTKVRAGSLSRSRKLARPTGIARVFGGGVGWSGVGRWIDGCIGQNKVHSDRKRNWYLDCKHRSRRDCV